MFNIRVILHLLICYRVYAQTLPDLILDVRLAGGAHFREGRVEIYARENVESEASWGTICDDGWDQYDAAVICRMLGIPGQARAMNGSFNLYGPGDPDTQRVWLSDVRCAGNEETIEQCPSTGLGTNTCVHSEDVAVVCLGAAVTTSTPRPTGPTTTTPPPTICDNPATDIRLTSGPNPAEGQVQIYRDNNWGNICDDDFGQAEAQVVCRMLCYNPLNARALLNSRYQNATYSFFLDMLACTGSEAHIQNCPGVNWFVTSCSEREAAAVSCLPDNPDEPRAPTPIIECTNDKITARFTRDGNPGFGTEHIGLANTNIPSNCGFVETADLNYVSIAIPISGCGTRREVNQTHIAYSNTVTHAVPANNPLITRTTVYHIDVNCVLSRDEEPRNNIQPNDRPAEPATGDGQFRVTMDLSLNQFATPITQFPAQVTLGDWVYVSVNLQTSDEELKIVVPECWATADADPESVPRYDFITNKCRAESTVTLYPLNQTSFAFRFQSFKFLGENRLYVYVHCKGFICETTDDTNACDRSCVSIGRKKRDVNNEEESSQLVNVLSELDMHTPNRFKRQVMGEEMLIGVRTVDIDGGPLAFLDTDPRTLQPLLYPVEARNFDGASHATPTADRHVLITTVTALLISLVLR